jgi:hypothetical protein
VTIVEVTGEVVCPMPMVGGKIAAFLGGDVESSLRAEEAFVDGYLGEQMGGDAAPRSPQRRAS